MKKDLRFKYDDTWRQVSNATIEWGTFTLVGFEIRKNGKFSYRIKRFSLEKMDELTFVKPYLRSGPKIGLPA